MMMMLMLIEISDDDVADRNDVVDQAVKLVAAAEV